MTYKPAPTETERLLRERLARLNEMLELLEREHAWLQDFQRQHRTPKGPAQ